MNLDVTVGMLGQYSTKENSTGKNSPSYESDCQYLVQNFASYRLRKYKMNAR